MYIFYIKNIMIKRFPLPYTSLTSCYYGLIGKDYGGIQLQRPMSFKNEKQFVLGKHCVIQNISSIPIHIAFFLIWN